MVSSPLGSTTVLDASEVCLYLASEQLGLSIFDLFPTSEAAVPVPRAVAVLVMLVLALTMAYLSCLRV